MPRPNPTDFAATQQTSTKIIYGFYLNLIRAIPSRIKSQDFPAVLLSIVIRLIFTGLAILLLFRDIRAPSATRLMISVSHLSWDIQYMYNVLFQHHTYLRKGDFPPIRKQR